MVWGGTGRGGTRGRGIDWDGVHSGGLIVARRVQSPRGGFERALFLNGQKLLFTHCLCFSVALSSSLFSFAVARPQSRSSAALAAVAHTAPTCQLTMQKSASAVWHGIYGVLEPCNLIAGFGRGRGTMPLWNAFWCSSGRVGVQIRLAES